MPSVTMPDGTLVNMPDKLDPETGKRLRSLLGSQKRSQPVSTPSLLKGMFLGGPVPGPMEAGRQIVSGVKDIAKKGVLPTVGAIGGGFVGGVPGEMIGSGAGEIANQAFGLTEKSPFQVGLVAAAPGVGRMIGPAAGFLRRFGTPTRAAQTLNTLATPEALQQMERIVGKVLPSQATTALFKQAEAEGGKIPMENASEELMVLVKKMEKWSPGSSALKTLKTIQKNLQAGQGAFSPSDLQDALEVAGKSVHALEKTEGSAFGASKKVFEAMSKDLDAAIESGIPSAGILKLARQTFKRNKSIEEMTDYIGKATKTLRGQETTQFNGNQVINAIKGDRFYKESFTPQERKEIEDLFLKLNRIPVLRPGAGVQAGSYRRAASLITGAVGGSAGFGAGGPFGSAAGTAIGSAVPPAVESFKMIAQTMHFDAGRALLRQLINQGAGNLTPRSMSIISAFLRTQTASPAQMGVGPGIGQQLQVPQGPAISQDTGNGTVQGF